MKFLKIVALVIVLLVVVVTVLRILGSRDVPTVTDADLLLAPVPVLTESNNAYYFLPELEEVTDLSDRALTDAFIAASKKPGYQCPTTVNNYSYEAETCPLNQLRDLARLTAARATSSLASGDVADAVESSVATLRMSHLVTASDGQLIEELVGMAIYDIAADALVEIVPTLAQQQKSTVAVAIENYRPNKVTLQNAHRYDYMQIKEAINQITQGGPMTGREFVFESQPSAYRWHPNRTANNIAEVYRLQTSQCGIDCDTTQISKEIERSQHMTPWHMLLPNGAGNILFAVYAGSLNSVYDRMDELEATYDELAQSLK